ncbi:hypothetical protein CHUAL_012877 [Chamberlinius hualienensis]
MFTGLFKRRESDLPIPTASLTPLELQRQGQVENLKKLNPTVIELNRNQEFILVVQLNKEIKISLQLSLPSQFPKVKPIVVVSPPVKHPWINDKMQIVGSPGLKNFSIHSELGEVVLGIVQEFHTNPPRIIATKVADQLSFSQITSTMSSASSSTPNAVYKPGSGKSVLHLPFPPIPSFQATVGSLLSEFPELKTFSTKQLQELQNDDEKLQEYIERLHIVKKINTERDELCGINEELAKENISKEPILEAKKKNLLELVDEISNLRHQFDDLSHKYQILSDQYSPSSIQESLKFAALQAEDESEHIAQSFLEGKIEIEEFLPKFMERRILSHNRKAKEERLNQQLMELKKSGF